MVLEIDHCQWLRDLLGGEVVELYLCELSELREHWQECDRCRASLPETPSQLAYISTKVQANISHNLEHIYHQYRSDEHLAHNSYMGGSLNALTNTENYLSKKQVLEFKATSGFQCEPAPIQRHHAQLLNLLARAGADIRHNLQVLNDSWGCDHFRVVSFADDCEYNSNTCGPLIASLPRECQVFLFEALLAADHLDMLSDGLEPENACIIYRTLQQAAPGFLERYLTKEAENIQQKEPIAVADAVRKGLDKIAERIEQSARDMDDLGDSLKAAQNEIIRRIQPRGKVRKGMEEYELFLVDVLGKDVYGQLHRVTRQHLKRGEWAFNEISEPDGHELVVGQYAMAFENQLMVALRRCALAIAAELDVTSWPENPLTVVLIIGGRLNRKLTLGQALGYIKHDEIVQQALLRSRIHIEKVVEEGYQVLRMRNRVTHPQDPTTHGDKLITREDAEGIRHLLLGEFSSFRSLPPSEGIRSEAAD